MEFVIKHKSSWPLLVLFFLLSIGLHANDQDKINWKDDQGRKQGHWIIFGKDRPEQGVPPEGKVEEVNEYLGRYYTMAGYVVHGEKRGRKLGFPTANLQIDDRYVYPRNGEYVVRLYVNGTWVNGVASIGYNPTFNEEKTKRFVEVYLLDFDDDIYGQSVILEWRKYLRDELKFDSIDDLILQMKQDEQDARNYFKQMS